jgi:hypothetical protein
MRWLMDENASAGSTATPKPNVLRNFTGLMLLDSYEGASYDQVLVQVLRTWQCYQVGHRA